MALPNVDELVTMVAVVVTIFLAATVIRVHRDLRLLVGTHFKVLVL